MHPSLWISKSGLDAQEQSMRIASQNLANANNTGYKKARAVFKDLLYQKVEQPGTEVGTSEVPSGLMLGTGVKLVATQKDFSQGSPVKTDNPLHVSINGKGFFQVLLPDGNTGFTRDGTLAIDSNGQLVTQDGYPIQPSISLPADVQHLTIGNDGTISGKSAGTSTLTTYGNMQIADFINPAGLEPIGDNIYVESQASGSATIANPGTSGLGLLDQGTLEASNVNSVEELINLIQIQRGYEMNAKAIESVDGMLKFISQVL